jgi:lipoprotein-releasing system ATP-binding protein
MSKVQSPKSASEPRGSIPADEGSLGETNRVKDADAGPWTLDIGLSVTDLRKSFLSPGGENIDVLRGVSFSAHPGQAVAITGASGAGKSTLLNLLGGLEAPDHGSIVLGRFEIDRATPAHLATFRRSHVGLVFQFHHLLADLSAAENVALPLLIARTNHVEAMRRAREALKEIGLAERHSHPVGHLSGGEQQRVATCRALITNPALVLADEPTGNLDAAFANELGERLVNYSRLRRAIVLIATHNERLAQVCDRVLIISDGRLSDG